MAGTIILSPSLYSKYTLAVLVGLQRAGVGIRAVAIRRLFNLQRVVSESQRDGRRLFGKVWRKLILRKRVYKCERNDQYTASGFLKTHDISYVPIPEICRRSTIPVIWTNDFNNDSFVRQIFNIQPDIIVFTGGGLIRKQLLDIAPLGVLNAHSGILPEYRGMDVPEWAILQGDLQGLGVTIHIMDAGIDTGPILSTHPLRLKPGDDIKRLRDRIDYLLSEAMIETTCDYLAERISPRPQRVEDGRQYFVMDPLLIELTATKLSRTS